jgi:hypothetical protein
LDVALRLQETKGVAGRDPADLEPLRQGSLRGQGGSDVPKGAVASARLDPLRSRRPDAGCLADILPKAPPYGPGCMPVASRCPVWTARWMDRAAPSTPHRHART